MPYRFTFAPIIYTKIIQINVKRATAEESKCTERNVASNITLNNNKWYPISNILRFDCPSQVYEELSPLQKPMRKYDKDSLLISKVFLIFKWRLHFICSLPELLSGVFAQDTAPNTKQTKPQLWKSFFCVEFNFSCNF